MKVQLFNTTLNIIKPFMTAHAACNMTYLDVTSQLRNFIPQV